MSDWVITSKVPDEKKESSDWVMTSSMPSSVESEPAPFNWAKALAAEFGKGILTNADILREMGKGFQLPEDSEAAKLIAENFDTRTPFEQLTGHEGDPSKWIEQTEIPTNAAQRMAMSGAKMAGAATPLGGGLIAPAIGAATGVASSGLQELGVNPLLADLTAGLSVGAASNLKNLFKKKLSSSEIKVLNTLKQQMSPQEFERTLANFEKAPQYKTINYQPATAEVAGSPALSQLHRVRQGIPESGLAQRASEQNEAIQSVFEPMKMNPSSASQIREGLKGELSKATNIRYKAARPHYKNVEEMEEKLNPKHLRAYLKKKEATSSGRLLRDVDDIKSMIKRNKIPASEKEYADFYRKSSDVAKKTLEKPTNVEPEIRKLSGVYEELNSKIEKYARTGEKKRKLIVSKAKKALEKDLEVVPEWKEAVSKYAKLSERVNAIEKHKTLKKVLKSNANEIMPEIFDKNSADNMKALKNALGSNESEWNGIRDATADYFHKSISNAGAEGRSHVMSYPKLNNFLKRHETALKEVFEPEQLKFVDELKHALHGQNIAKTLGEGPGSATAARTALNDILKQGFGLRTTEAITKYSPLPGALKNPMQFLLNRYISKNQANALKVLDEVLLNPESARKLMSHEFSSQMDFNKYMKNMITSAAPSLREASRQEEDHE